MASTWNTMTRMLGVAIPTSMAALAIGSGMAIAQETCPDETLDPSVLPIVGFKGYMKHADAVTCANTYGGGNVAHGCFRFDGSDTLTDVMHGAIRSSGACLTYHNIGSGQAETNLRFTAGDSGVTGTVKQCLGPMSRNFAGTVLTAHPTWAPTPPDNIKALDAAVWSFKRKTGQAVNIDNFPAGVCVNECPLVQNHTLTAAAVILGGYPQGSNTKSEATTPECADPCRECLVGWLASPSMEGSGHIEHIYRRDDKSGTQDTIREKYVFDRWCNGKGEGNFNNPGSNLVNEDLDPIRRSCVGADATHALTRCTYYPTSQNCQAGDADIPAHGSLTIRGVTVTNSYAQPLKCSEGLVVTLSENDPGVIGDGVTNPDITQSIGMRVASDGLGQSIGICGFASGAAPNPPNAVLNVNTITTTFPNNIYTGNYLLSRRLFLQTPFGENFASTCPVATSGNPGEVAGRIPEEQKLWDFTINHECDPDGSTLGMQSISKNAGFFAKWAPAVGCGNTQGCIPAAVSNTLTCLAPDPGVGTPKQNIGDETSNNACDASYPCVANGQVGTGTPLTCGGVGSVCPVMPTLAASYGCNLGTKCSSGTCNDDGSGKGGICQ